MTQIFKKIVAAVVLVIFVLSVVPVALAETSDAMHQRAAARKHFVIAKEKEEDAKEKYERHRAQVALLKEEQETCETKECTQEVKEKLRAGRKIHVLNAVEVLNKALLKLQDKVELSDLTEEQKVSLGQQIDAFVAQLAEQQLALASSDLDGKELAEILDELKSLHAGIKLFKHETVALLTVDHTEQIVDKLDQMIEAMQKRIDSQKAQGVDTAHLEIIFEEFKNDVAQVKSASTRVQEKYDLAQKSASQEPYRELHKARADFKDALHEAKQTMKKFIHAYKALAA